MLILQVPDMSCGGCASTVGNAVRSVDPAAQIAVDLASKRVSIESSASVGAIAAAIQAAGYRSTSID